MSVFKKMFCEASFCINVGRFTNTHKSFSYGVNMTYGAIRKGSKNDEEKSKAAPVYNQLIARKSRKSRL